VREEERYAMNQGTKMHEKLNTFQRDISLYFNEMKLGVAFSAVGQYIDKPEEIFVAQRLGPGLIEEPVPLSGLILHSHGVASGVTELFVIRAIAAWNDLLSSLFSDFVEAHLNGVKLFPKFNIKKCTFDFSSSVPIQQQVRYSIAKDFSFSPYKVRIKIIKSSIESIVSNDDSLAVVRKFVEIRNSFQHHNGLVTADLLNELGIAKLELIDSDCNPVLLVEHEKIILTATECDNLKSALFRITNAWRASNADL
jgi:hypothetical protein